MCILKISEIIALSVLYNHLSLDQIQKINRACTKYFYRLLLDGEPAEIFRAGKRAFVYHFHHTIWQVIANPHSAQPTSRCNVHGCTTVGSLFCNPLTYCVTHRLHWVSHMSQHNILQLAEEDTNCFADSECRLLTLLDVFDTTAYEHAFSCDEYLEHIIKRFTGDFDAMERLLYQFDSNGYDYILWDIWGVCVWRTGTP
jgi:hypothetical protein